MQKIQLILQTPELGSQRNSVATDEQDEHAVPEVRNLRIGKLFLTILFSE